MRRRERGTAAAEMAILLPLYVLLMFGFLFFGFRGILKIRMHEAVRFALAKPGAQQAADAEPFVRTLEEEAFKGEGRVTDFREAIDAAALPSAAAIEEALIEETYDPQGHFEFDWSAGVVRFVLDPNRLSRLGRYILRNNLIALSPQAADVGNGWLHRSQVNLGYRSDIFGMSKELDLDNADLAPSSGQSIVRGARDRGRHAGHPPPAGQDAVLSLFGLPFPAPRADTARFFEAN